MEQFVYNLKERISADIQDIEASSSDILQESLRKIQVLENAFEELRSFIDDYIFKSELEEIHFFKEVKPRMFSQLVYCNKLYTIEIRMPAGSIHDKQIYLESMLGRIKYFFDMNFDFYQYYRSGNTHLDKYYFLRGKKDIQLILDSFYFERNANFSTSHDFKVAKILANEMLTVYLNNKLLRLEQQPQYSIKDNTGYMKGKHTWTGSKTDLVEMLYGIHLKGCLNNGNIDLKELADYFGIMLNTDLKDIYRIYLNLRSRKGSRTQFLDCMIDALNKKMDEDDRR
jgi:hypothetical protein